MQKRLISHSNDVFYLLSVLLSCASDMLSSQRLMLLCQTMFYLVIYCLYTVLLRQTHMISCQAVMLL